MRPIWQGLLGPSGHQAHKLSHRWDLCLECEELVFVLTCTCGDELFFHTPVACEAYCK
jgi:hypothetical protein